MNGEIDMKIDEECILLLLSCTSRCETYRSLSISSVTTPRWNFTKEHWYACHTNKTDSVEKNGISLIKIKLFYLKRYFSCSTEANDDFSFGEQITWSSNATEIDASASLTSFVVVKSSLDGNG